MSRLPDRSRRALRQLAEFDQLFDHASAQGSGPLFAPGARALVRGCEGALMCLRALPESLLSSPHALPHTLQPLVTDDNDNNHSSSRQQLQGQLQHDSAQTDTLFTALDAVLERVNQSLAENNLKRLWSFARPRHRVQLLAALCFSHALEVLRAFRGDAGLASAKNHQKVSAAVARQLKKILAAQAKAARKRDKHIGKMPGALGDVGVLLCADGQAPQCVESRKEQQWWVAKFGAGTAVVEWTAFIAELRGAAKLERALEPIVRYFVDFCATGTVSVHSFAAFTHAFGPVQDANLGARLMHITQRKSFHGYLTQPEVSRLLAGHVTGTYAVFVSHLEFPRNHGAGNMGVTSVLSCAYVGVSASIETLPILNGTVDDFLQRYDNLCKFPLITPLTSMPWFYGDINAREAADRLATARAGSWLCRFSSQSLTALALSYLTDRFTVESAVVEQPQPDVVLYQGQKFASVRDLISNLSKTHLKIPVVLTSFATRERQLSYNTATQGNTAQTGSLGAVTNLTNMTPDALAAASQVGGGALYNQLPTDEMFAATPGNTDPARPTNQRHTMGALQPVSAAGTSGNGAISSVQVSAVPLRGGPGTVSAVPSRNGPGTGAHYGVSPVDFNRVQPGGRTSDPSNVRSVSMNAMPRGAGLQPDQGRMPAPGPPTQGSHVGMQGSSAASQSYGQMPAMPQADVASPTAGSASGGSSGYESTNTSYGTMPTPQALSAAAATRPTEPAAPVGSQFYGTMPTPGQIAEAARPEPAPGTPHASTTSPASTMYGDMPTPVQIEKADQQAARRPTEKTSTGAVDTYGTMPTPEALAGAGAHQPVFDNLYGSVAPNASSAQPAAYSAEMSSNWKDSQAPGQRPESVYGQSSVARAAVLGQHEPKQQPPPYGQSAHVRATDPGHTQNAYGHTPSRPIEMQPAQPEPLYGKTQAPTPEMDYGRSPSRLAEQDTTVNAPLRTQTEYSKSPSAVRPGQLPVVNDANPGYGESAPARGGSTVYGGPPTSLTSQGQQQNQAGDLSYGRMPSSRSIAQEHMAAIGNVGAAVPHPVEPEYQPGPIVAPSYDHTPPVVHNLRTQVQQMRADPDYGAMPQVAGRRP